MNAGLDFLVAEAVREGHLAADFRDQEIQTRVRDAIQGVLSRYRLLVTFSPA